MSSTALLTPAFFARYRAVPQRPWWDLFAAAARAHMALVGFKVDVENAERIPRRPALLCTNSTHPCDFLALMKGLDQLGQRVVTISKAKNFHHPAMAWVMKRAGVVPLASRGYFLLADFLELHGRRPSDVEYRALRDHLDTGAPVGAAVDDAGALAAVLRTPRAIAGHAFNPSAATWRDTVQLVNERAVHETLRLAREAVAAGFHVQIYPEGTVSPTLGTGRSGAVQLAHALGIDVVPVGMSGAPDAFLGRSPVPRRGRVILRVGATVDARLPRAHRAFSPADERAHALSLAGATARVMAALSGLVDARYRRATDAGAAPAGKGTRAHL